MNSMTQWSLNQLAPAIDNSLESESNVSITVRRSYEKVDDSISYPYINPTSQVSFEVEFPDSQIPQIVNLLKCILLLSLLPQEGLDEAVSELESIKEYYSDFTNDFDSSQESLPPKVIKAKVNPAQTRPPLVLDLD